MRILVLTFYFPPDLSACSFRIRALVDALGCILPPDSQVDVVTTQPNRYAGFRVPRVQPDGDARVSITRLRIPEHESGLLDQSRSFLAFWRQATKLASYGRYDLVVATSSRLMTAVLGAWIARRQRARLYLDVRDIFVETIAEVLPKGLARMTAPIFDRLEKWTVSRAARVNLVSPGFAGYFEARYPEVRLSYFPNGIDDEFIGMSRSRPAVRRDGDTSPIIVVYAGNLGEGQGLHLIVPALAERMRERVRFRIIGDGGRRRALEEALSTRNINNVELRPPVRRDELLKEYQAADVLFLHLNDYRAFRRVLPSKIFEYAALGKPVWAGVAGYAAEFVQSEIENAAVFHPCDVDDAAESFERLVLAHTPRQDFVAKYARAGISERMAKDVVAVAKVS